ncbi:MAG: hypothetical protein AAGH64_01830 [Planctomycetota bacterium]
MRTTAPLAIAALLLASCTERAPETPVAAEPEPATPPEPVLCACVLGSWVVAGRGRHLHLDIDCPEEFDHLDGRIEFTSAALRSDYDPLALEPESLPHLVRMTPGRRLYSPIDDPRPRVEAEYTVDAATAAWMQRDIAFTTDYILLGSNSNSAMRAMLQAVGLEVPASVLAGNGYFGAFPGIDQDPGRELPVDQWPSTGLPGGPRPVPGPHPDAWDATPPIGSSPAERAVPGA